MHRSEREVRDLMKTIMSIIPVMGAHFSNAGTLPFST